MRPASLLRAWQMQPWMKRLSGLTLPPSTASRGVARWISSLPAHPASPTVSPERERDSMTNEAAPSSNTSPESSRKSRPDWSSWKTSGSGGQADFFASSESSYSDWVTESLRRSRLLRETLAHRIDGSAGGAWPTAQTHDGEGWPGKGTRERGGRQACLNVAVTTWPTPNARDHKGSLPLDARDRTMGTLDEAAERIFSLPPQTTPLTGQPSSQSNQNAPRRLNPIFVEWLMGWPPHYTNAQIALDAQAMASYRFAARSHFTSLCRTPGYRSPKNGGQNDCG